MDEKALVTLLRNVDTGNHAGFVDFQILAFAESNHFLERTPEGNLVVTEKGLHYLQMHQESGSPHKSA